MSFKNNTIESLRDKILSLIGLLLILLSIFLILVTIYLAFSPLEGLYMNSDSAETYDTIGKIYMYDIDHNTESINVYSDGVSGKTTFEIHYINSLGVTSEGFGGGGSNIVSSKESKTIDLEEGSNEISINSDSSATMIAVQTEVSDSYISENKQISSRVLLFFSNIIISIFVLFLGYISIKEEI